MKSGFQFQQIQLSLVKLLNVKSDLIYTQFNKELAVLDHSFRHTCAVLDEILIT